MTKVSWIYDFKHSVADVWDYVTKTERINEMMGLPPVKYTTQARPDGSGQDRFGTYRVRGVKLEWKEHPYEWIRHQFFRIEREYSRGPMKYIRTDWEFEATDTGCRVKQTFHYDVIHPLLWIVGYFSIQRSTRQDFVRVYAPIDAYLDKALAETKPSMDLPLIHVLPVLKKSEEKIASLKHTRDYQNQKDKLVRAFIEESVAEKLLDFIYAASDLDLVKIRPFRFGVLLGLDRIKSVVTMLRACQAGLMTLSWSALCPLCRGSNATAGNLSQLAGEIHCDSCNINFKTDLSKGVELIFTPQKTFRDIQVYEYCIGSPDKTSHFNLQLRIKKGELHEVMVPLTEGTFKLRSVQAKGQLVVEVKENASKNPAPADATFVFSDTDTPDTTVTLQQKNLRLHIENRTNHEITVILERATWLEETCTAAFASSIQEFRSTFSSNLISLDQNINFSSVAFMFTDLKNSAELYQRLGDAKALTTIHKHFELLSDAIKANDGGIVKTLGDSVMAVFTHPEKALAAAVDAQLKMAAASGSHAFGNELFGEKIQTRIALHQGPCFLIQMNGIVDFFGNSVNLTARLLSQCDGNDIIISDAMFNDQMVRVTMKKLRITAEQKIRNFKGFVEEFEIYQILPAKISAEENPIHTPEKVA